MLLPMMFVLVCGMVGASGHGGFPNVFRWGAARTAPATPAPTARPAAATPQPAQGITRPREPIPPKYTGNLEQDYVAAEQYAFDTYKIELGEQIKEDTKSIENLAFKLESTLNMQRPNYFGSEFVEYDASIVYVNCFIRSLPKTLINKETQENQDQKVDSAKNTTKIKDMPIPDFNPKASTNPLITYFNDMRKICREIRKTKHAAGDSAIIKFDMRGPHKDQRTRLEAAARNTAQALAAISLEKLGQTINEALAAS